MRNLKTKIIVGVVALGAVLGVAVFVGESPDTAVRVVASNSKAPIKMQAPATETTAESATGKLAWASGASAQTVETMRVAYNAGGDRQAFFVAALQHPEAGGLYYARRTIMDCISIRAAKTALAYTKPQPVNPPSAATLRVYKEAASQCGGVTDSNSRRLLSAAYSSAAKASDPLASAMSEVREARVQNKMNLDIALMMVDRAITLGDPYLLTDALWEAISTASTFNGEPIDRESKSKLHLAAAVAQCSLGADCAHAPEVYMECLRLAQCPTSLMDVVLNRPDLPLPQRQKIFDLARQFVTSAKDGSIKKLFDSA